MSHNRTNPISEDMALPVSAVQEINRQHRHQAAYIREASMGSAALEQVRVHQYACAIAEARRAIGRVLAMQEQTMENVLKERSMPELDAELRSLGIIKTTEG